MPDARPHRSVRVVGLDHVVLLCADVERTFGWYHDRFGLERLRYDEWRAGTVPFPSLRIDAGTIVDFLAGARTGENVAHLALRVEPDGRSLDEVAADLEAEVVQPPNDRLYGARGIGSGVYVRDPEGNVIELRHYP
jgi:catechol 2,3-dioxygenase-like lactoylglutathione lyase family enzyme